MSAEDRRGFFVTLEGIEGSGKTTHRDRLASRLREQGVPVTVTREPGGTPLGEAVRRLLLGEGEEVPGPRAELLLMMATRAQHVDRVLLPALREGNVVLCDRYADASLAYQGGGRELDRNVVESMNRFATSGLVPDLTLLFDLDVETALERARGRSRKSTDRFDREETAFHQRVQSVYRELARRSPGRFVIVPADRTVEEVAVRVWAAVEPGLARARNAGAIG